MANNEKSPGGSRIYRHTAREQGWQPVSGDLESIQVIEEHIRNRIGPIENVFHEIISDLIHLDVYIVAPHTNNPCYTLITSGMSQLPMAVPPGLEEWRYAELLICLPPTWPLREEDFQHDTHYWPIRWLKKLARLPHEYNTWLAPSHTIPNGDPPQPFAATTKLCCALISQPVRFDQDVVTLEIGPAKQINLLSFVPIYREEMDYKLQHGIEALYEKFDATGVTELLDIKRKNSCAKRFGLW